jgi:hypothetical protein
MDRSSGNTDGWKDTKEMDEKIEKEIPAEINRPKLDK